jgi:hypothetical protein
MAFTGSSEYWADIIRKNILITEQLDTDNDTDELIDEAVLTAPRRGTARDTLAHETAARIYTDYPQESLAPIIQYEKDIVKLRSLAEQQRKNAIVKATEYNEKHNWIKRILKQNGPWNELEDPLSLNGAPSIPMPVEVSDPESLAPFFAHLRNNGTHQISNSAEADQQGESRAEPYYNVKYIEFEKGVLYSDGRIDLCKMVTGPRNIGDLMESLKPNAFSKHFLLGNNIVGPTGVEAIASFIEEGNVLNVRIVRRAVGDDVVDVVVTFPPAAAESAEEVGDNNANAAVNLKIVRDAHVASVVDCEHELMPEHSKKDARERIPSVAKEKERWARLVQFFKFTACWT